MAEDAFRKCDLNTQFLYHYTTSVMMWVNRTDAGMSNKGHLGSCRRGLGYEEQKPQLGKGRETDYKVRSESHAGLRQEVQQNHGATGMVFLSQPLSDH